jgi:hypothetical protein
LDLLGITTKKNVKKIVAELSKAILRVTGHGYESGVEITIGKAAEQSAKDYSKQYKAKPAMAIITVVLAANRNYNKQVKKKLDNIELNYRNLRSFKDLELIIKQKTKKQFFEFWGHADEKKFRTLKNILERIPVLRKKYSKCKSDFELFQKWAKDADFQNYKQDIIGSISNIGPATFQHLRMVFGVDTVKPDLRVKEVLKKEFGLPWLSDKKAVLAVLQIASIVNKKVIVVDQIFVKYGSSYYNQKDNKTTIMEVAYKLKKLGVDNMIIHNATGISIGLIDKM